MDELSSKSNSLKGFQSVNEQNPDQQCCGQQQNPEPNSTTLENGDWCDIEDDPPNFLFEISHIELKYDDAYSLSIDCLTNLFFPASFEP